jgi:hypothetical protein
VNESLSEWQMELEEDLNATADQDLGTAVAVCDGEGRYDDGSLLEVCELRYDVDSDSWAPQIVAASLLVDPLLLNAVTDPATETLHTTCSACTLTSPSACVCSPNGSHQAGVRAESRRGCPTLDPTTRQPTEPCPTTTHAKTG